MKSLLASKTFWVAALQAVAGVLLVFQGAYPEVGYIALGKSVVDVFLRAITDTKVTL